MRTIRDRVEGPQRITDDVTLHGMITGDVIVAAGGHLELHGMCSRSLRVESGGAVNLHGTVSGNVTNHGGRLVISGTIVGQLHDLAGETIIRPDAMVSGSRR
jgi:hypothetical protein